MVWAAIIQEIAAPARDRTVYLFNSQDVCGTSLFIQMGGGRLGFGLSCET